jgi:hypothetical protein
MPDIKELFFSKFQICTNFNLDIDSYTIVELEQVDETTLKKNLLAFNNIQQAVDNLSRPFIFYWGTKNISALDNNKILISDDLKKKIEKFGLNFYLLEPLNAHKGIKHQNVWYCDYYQDREQAIESLELDSIENFCVNHNLKSAKVYSAEHNIKNIFGRKYKRLILNTKLLFWPFGTVRSNFSFDADQITKKFWSGNKRYAAHRHAVAGYLISKVPRELLNLSWFCESNINDLAAHIDLNLFNDKKQCICKGIAELDKIAPITFDVDLTTKLSITGNHFIDFSKLNTDLSYNESFCAVVTETRFFQYTSLISEKIINPILNKKFFVIVGPPRTLHYLKLFGVKTFNRWIDESYDNELDHMRRLNKILDIIDYINAKDIAELRLIYNEMQEVILHNLKRVMILQRYWNDNKLHMRDFS